MQQIQLSIPEPCHQSWEGMTPTDQGRFCNACAKQVIDFSTMSDAQVLNYFSHIKNDNVCGRVYPDQLDRTIAMPVQPKKRIFGYWQYITMLFLFFGKGSNAKAQGGMKVVTAAKPDSIKRGSLMNNLEGKLIADGTREKITIRGGITSISNKQSVLYIVDGDIVSNNAVEKIAANDIERIEVLPAAKAMAIFGAMGSEGAILIIIKKKTGSQNYAPDKQGHVITIKVTDNAIMQPVDNATLTIAKIGNDKTTLVLTDKKGIVKIEKIKDNETYLIKITADGYRDQELQISGGDFDERKIHKEIFLEKAPLQSDYKKMDSVVITSYPAQGRICRAGGMSVTTIIKRTYKDSVSVLTTAFTSALKIAPNPIQKGNSFKVELKVKQTGLYQLQLIDAGGQQVMQKQISVTTKQYIQQLQSEFKWSSGTYFLRVLNDKNILISTAKLIIQ